MAGDVNMFLNGAPEDEDEFTAEVEIMIAGDYVFPISRFPAKSIPQNRITDAADSP